jgi:Fe-S-cluster-containing dehydrogenase component
MKPYGLVIDDKACWGCKACEVACKQENNAPDGLKLIKVLEDGPKRVTGRLQFQFKVQACKHCAKPACVKACSFAAISKRADGIVVLESAKCTGCRSCLEACPYAAIVFDETKEVALKCNLCHHRVDQGLLPACADNICLGHGIHFGDPAEIRQKIAEKRKLRGGRGEIIPKAISYSRTAHP